MKKTPFKIIIKKNRISFKIYIKKCNLPLFHLLLAMKMINYYVYGVGLSRSLESQLLSLGKNEIKVV